LQCGQVSFELTDIIVDRDFAAGQEMLELQTRHSSQPTGLRKRQLLLLEQQNGDLLPQFVFRHPRCFDNIIRYDDAHLFFPPRFWDG
jgi:hypothetical protein